MSEIENTPTDRAALTLILDAVGQPAAIDTDGATISDLRREWARVAAQLFRFEDEVFNGFQDRLFALSGESYDDTPEAGRAAELVSYVVEARHMAWRSAEEADGRDPDRPA
jgi:hypothetical protein